MTNQISPPHSTDQLSVGTWVTFGNGFSQRRAVITTPEWGLGWTEGQYPIHYIDGSPYEEAHATVAAEDLTILPGPTTPALDADLLPDRLLKKYAVRWSRGMYTPAHGLHATTIAFEYALRNGNGRLVGGPDSIVSPRYRDWISEEMGSGLKYELPELPVPRGFDMGGAARRACDKVFFIGFGYRNRYRNLDFTGADWWTIEKTTWGVDCRNI